MMSMGFRMRAAMVLRCSLCDHNRSDDCDPVAVALLGAAAYGYCPLCKHPSGSAKDEPEWRAKVDAWFTRKESK